MERDMVEAMCTASFLYTLWANAARAWGACRICMGSRSICMEWLSPPRHGVISEWLSSQLLHKESASSLGAIHILLLLIQNSVSLGSIVNFLSFTSFCCISVSTCLPPFVYGIVAVAMVDTGFSFPAGSVLGRSCLFLHACPYVHPVRYFPMECINQ